MTTPSAAKGARGEREVVEMFRAAGFTQAQRSRAGAEEDRGDLASVPNLTIEVKNWNRPLEAIACGLIELEVERRNNGTDHGVLFVKRPRKGWVAVMPADRFVALYAEHVGVTPDDPGAS